MSETQIERKPLGQWTKMALWMFERRVAIMPLVTFGMVVIFGGLTLYLQDEWFIKVKPTIINIMFGVATLGVLYILKIPTMKLLFDGPFNG